MSFILDALRKSEAARRRSEAPDLFATMPDAVAPVRARTQWPLAIGASSDFGRSMLAFRRSYLPRGVDTSSGTLTPTGTWLAAPFQTFGCASGLLASYRLCDS